MKYTTETIKQLKPFSNFIFLWLLLYLGTAVCKAGETVIASTKTYRGSDQCKTCHLNEFRDWQLSDHFKSMSPATANSVLGNFNNIAVQFNGLKSRFYKNGEQYYVETSNAQGQQEKFKVSYTFGYYPLQQYLIKVKNGHIQALNIAWDSREEKEGGQRWFHLRKDELVKPESLFYWTKHFQNWNNRCAECHSTNLIKSYDANNLSYKTTWAEINVGCEACHGPASEHLVLVNSSRYSNANSGFNNKLLETSHWAFSDNETIAQASNQDINSTQSAMLNRCGGCHSRRTTLKNINPEIDFHEQYRLQTLDDGLYYADGQIKGEVFVMGSFMQSKMHAKGVSCSNCHNSHSGKLLIKGNGLCLQCHAPNSFDNIEHHGHQKNSKGSLCVNCHMPSTTYMEVDERRDHSFTIPRPNLSDDFDIPNACTGCHKDKSNDWAQTNVKTLKAKTINNHNFEWIDANIKARLVDPQLLKTIKATLAKSSLSNIKQATLIAQLAEYPAESFLNVITPRLNDQDPLIRRASITAFKNARVELKIKYLLPLLNDPILSVRTELGSVLADVLPLISNEQYSKTIAVIDEYRQSLFANNDSPIGTLALANLELSLGNIERAENYCLKALTIEPSYIPAMINLADIYRLKKSEVKVGQWLQKAVTIAKNNSDAQHAYGLHFVRIKQMKKALKHLKLAIENGVAKKKYYYIYAIALHNSGKKDEAINVLEKALFIWTSDQNLQRLLASYQVTKLPSY